MTSLSVIMAVLVINLYNRGTYMQVIKPSISLSIHLFSRLISQPSSHILQFYISPTYSHMYSQTLPLIPFLPQLLTSIQPYISTSVCHPHSPYALILYPSSYLILLHGLRISPLPPPPSNCFLIVLILLEFIILSL